MNIVGAPVRSQPGSDRPSSDPKTSGWRALQITDFTIAILVSAVLACSTGVIPEGQEGDAVGIYKSSAFDPSDCGNCQ